MRVFVRCAACRLWMRPDPRLLAGPFFMCEFCWDGYWNALGVGDEERPGAKG